MAGAVHLMGLRMATAAGAHVSTYRGAAIFAKRSTNSSGWFSWNENPTRESFFWKDCISTFIFISIHIYIYFYYTLAVANIAPLNIRIWETFSFPGKVGLCLFVFGVI